MASSTPVFDSVRDNDLAKLKLLIAEGKNINQPGIRGHTPLYIAADDGNVEIVKTLLAARADVNAASKIQINVGIVYIMSPLYIATLKEHVDVVKVLLTAGANVNSETEHKETPLHVAAQTGNIETIKLLLAAGANVNAVSTTNDTPLMFAAERGFTESVKELIAAGANVNLARKGNYTPLYKAVEQGYLEVIELLLAAGANVNAALSYNNYTPLHRAVKKGFPRTTKMLLEAGADVNKSTYDKITPLYLAAEDGSTEIARILLAAGADVTKPNYGGKSIVQWANEGAFIPEIKRLFLRLHTHAKPANAPSECFNPILAETGPIDPSNATFFVLKEDGTTAFSACLDADSLKTYITSTDYLFYRCKDTVPDSALHIIRGKNTLAEPIRLLNFQQRVYVFDYQSSKLTTGKMYVCIPKEKVGRIVSEHFLAGGSAVSATHCQPEDGSMLYEIKEISMAGGSRSRRRATRRSAVRRKGATRRGSKKYKYRVSN